jgi:hypothetical protein
MHIYRRIHYSINEKWFQNLLNKFQI